MWTIEKTMLQKIINIQSKEKNFYLIGFVFAFLYKSPISLRKGI